ncbi:uncharacterized protein N7515_004979 [Penicillium bovifimosum]|uniref:PSI domain-containing protein n=1 Tax=Penicillium bovifimosum TaxID=126998 RepID=A0A9W9H149_9EURO|nr:uncharacterized protein N7515_004979 [Penicillium bovifimosum]KAJ5135701.1 hypothetical protein N7515_004979 [Penicillium bovifimosum]
MDDLELLGNHSIPLNSPEPNDPLFHVCWRRQSCSYCLTGDVPCSWCAISSTCVPNPSRVPILAPIGSSGICPLGSKEEWELRAISFGCHASTLTVISVSVAVLATLALGGMVVGLVWLVRRIQRRWKEDDYEQIEVEEQEEPRGHFWGFRLASFVSLFPFQLEGTEAETRPLLQ